MRAVSSGVTRLNDRHIEETIGSGTTSNNGRDTETTAELRRHGKTIREIAIAVHAPRATVARALSQNPPPPAASGRPARKRAVVAGRK